jgi:cytochrome P450
LIAPLIMHRHRRFRRASDRFDLSRFSPAAPSRPRFAYIPFGAGPRICVGSPRALTELLLVVLSLVRAVRIELPPHRPVARSGSSRCSRMSLHPSG